MNVNRRVIRFWLQIPRLTALACRLAGMLSSDLSGSLQGSTTKCIHRVSEAHKPIGLIRQARVR